MEKRAAGSKASYEVGYGKPPPEYRFPPGTSGNRKGRPPASGTFAAAVRAQGDALITVLVGGKPVRMAIRDISAKQLYQQAAHGKAWALALVSKIEGQGLEVSGADIVEEFEVTLVLEEPGQGMAPHEGGFRD